MSCSAFFDRRSLVALLVLATTACSASPDKPDLGVTEGAPPAPGAGPQPPVPVAPGVVAVAGLPAAGSPQAPGAPGQPEPGSILIAEPSPPTLAVPGLAVAPGTKALPANLGTELLCDGIDENGNGITDDVDVGRDGLCDCINMGFFGQIASDAGLKTGSFEAWLVARSGQVPVKHLAANAPLTEEWLASLQVLIVGGMQGRVKALGNGPYFTPAEIQALDNWLQVRGGGMMTLAGYSNSPQDAAPAMELLASSGLGYDTRSVPPEGVIGEDAAPPVWLNDMPTPTHPTVDQVPQIGVFFGYPVTGDGSVILRGGGHDLAQAKEVGSGRVFAFADEWITQDQTWSVTVNGQADPCNQPCTEEISRCGAAEANCDACAMQPCSDPAETDAATCTKGCQPSCDNEMERCAEYAEQCQVCSAEFNALQAATPRFWLNTISWLTPTTECKVVIPPVIRIQ